MAKIVFFCIPAHGHTNPTLPVVKALPDAGHEVIYYSYEAFRPALESAGAQFMGCERFDIGFSGGDDAPNGAAVARDITVAADLITRATLAMDEPVTRELKALSPDVIVADSAAYWGKLFALKLGIPFICSTTTFAFNRYSSRIMKTGLEDLLKLLWRLPKTRRILQPLRERGYAADNLLSIVQNDDRTPTVVYTSREFQPFAETFPECYTFVGPCLRPSGPAIGKTDRPLIYVSMGTVIGGEDRFYRECVEAFSDGRYDVILSLGESADTTALGALPENIRAYPRVDQLAVLRSADAFVTHCGMNSVSEALYFGVPLVMRPLTPEERGVANRVSELGAGVQLKGGLRAAVDRVLTDPACRASARGIGEGFRRCGGPEAAAEAILKACVRP